MTEERTYLYVESQSPGKGIHVEYIISFPESVGGWQPHNSLEEIASLLKKKILDPKFREKFPHPSLQIYNKIPENLGELEVNQEGFAVYRRPLNVPEINDFFSYMASGENAHRSGISVLEH